MTRRSSDHPVPTRTASALAAVVLAGAAMLATSATGASAATGATTATTDTVDVYTGLHFTVPAGNDDLGQPQTCTIDADLYRPHSSGPSARVPAILTTNGFGGS